MPREINARHGKECESAQYGPWVLIIVMLVVIQVLVAFRVSCAGGLHNFLRVCEIISIRVDCFEREIISNGMNVMV